MTDAAADLSQLESPPPATATRVYIEYMPLGILERWPRNPKRHAIEDMRASISRFGYTEPVLIDERTQKLAAGHGRLDALIADKEAGKLPPTNIDVDTDGEWLVPVIRGVSFNSDQELEAYLVASNNLTTLGGWDNPDLAAILSELAEQGEALLAGTGINPAQVDEILEQLTQPPEPPELPNEDDPSGSGGAGKKKKKVTCPHCGKEFET